MAMSLLPNNFGVFGSPGGDPPPFQARCTQGVRALGGRGLPRDSLSRQLCSGLPRSMCAALDDLHQQPER